MRAFFVSVGVLATFLGLALLGITILSLGAVEWVIAATAITMGGVAFVAIGFLLCPRRGAARHDGLVSERANNVVLAVALLLLAALLSLGILGNRDTGEDWFIYTPFSGSGDCWRLVTENGRSYDVKVPCPDIVRP